MSKPEKDGPNVTCLGQIVVLLFLAGCIYGAYWLFTRSKPVEVRLANSGASQQTREGDIVSTSPASGTQVEIGIAYGTEKERWLKVAVEKFATTKEGRNVKINLIPKGSVEGGQAVLGNDRQIHVWSPASALYTDVVVQEWKLRNNKPLFLHEESLALSPMVFVFWKERYDEFIKRYGEASFKTISQALAEPGGWDGIAKKPEWGLFKFGHTHPNESNSGLMTLVLLAYNYSNKTQGLVMKDILDPGFQTWMTTLEKAVSGLSNSTGTMMKQMVLRGPASFDALFVYENVAIDFLENAKGRWGELTIVYPTQNMWNDNPYYILDVPWSSAEQRNAAKVFLDFLLSEPIQKDSLTNGFRPGNPAVPIKFSGSPFEKYTSYGVKTDIGAVCEPPRAEVLQNLLESWQRSVGTKSR